MELIFITIILFGTLLKWNILNLEATPQMSKTNTVTCSDQIKNHKDNLVLNIIKLIKSMISLFTFSVALLAL